MHSIHKRHQTTYFCMNYPLRAIERLQACVERKPGLLYRELFLDTLARDDSMKKWQQDIGN
jgi:hypothetical protein